MKKILIIAVVCVVAMYYLTTLDQTDFLDGYWESSLAFCQKSDIKNAQIYFHDTSAYIIIEGKQELIINKCVDFTTRRCLKSFIGDDDIYTIQFSEDVEPLPQELELRVNVNCGLLGLFKDGTLYLELFKNNKATNGII